MEAYDGINGFPCILDPYSRDSSRITADINFWQKPLAIILFKT